MTTENNQPQEAPDNLDIGSVLASATDEQLENVDTFEEFMAQQSIQPEEPNKQDKQEETTTSDNQSSEEQKNSESEPEQKTEPETEQSTELTDAEFRQLVTASFRANHQDVQVDNPDDIRKLMQFGMNYHKKMGELAPHRKILKSLEQNGLLEADKINFAIDLLKGDKAAVAKFLKDQSIDTYELPDLEETPYQSKNYLPSDERVAFDEKTQELQNSEAGQRVLSYIKNLDQESFFEVYSNPVILDNLQRHAEIGLMNDTLAILEKEYALGNVPANIKPIDAYAHVAEQLQSQNPSKYNSSHRTQKVVGNNLAQNQQVKTQSPKAPTSASIPNNTQAPQRQQSYSGIDALLNAKEEDLAKYNNWEEYLQANNINI